MTTEYRSGEGNDDEPEYTAAECIDMIVDYLDRDGRIYPIDLAISALHWLERAPTPLDGYRPSKAETVELLREWLKTDAPNLGLGTIEHTLHWLRRCCQ